MKLSDYDSLAEYLEARRRELYSETSRDFRVAHKLESAPEKDKMPDLTSAALNGALKKHRDKHFESHSVKRMKAVKSSANGWFGGIIASIKHAHSEWLKEKNKGE